MTSGTLLHYSYHCIVIGCLNAKGEGCVCVCVCVWGGGGAVYYGIIF